MKTNFPIKYNNKLYYKNDCDEFFLDYLTIYNVCDNGGIYLGEDMYLFPNGEMLEE